MHGSATSSIRIGLIILGNLVKCCRKSESKEEKSELKDEDDLESRVKEDPESEDESDGGEETREEADIRDIRYKLEILAS